MSQPFCHLLVANPTLHIATTYVHACPAGGGDGSEYPGSSGSGETPAHTAGFFCEHSRYRQPPSWLAGSVLTNPYGTALVRKSTHRCTKKLSPSALVELIGVYG